LGAKQRNKVTWDVHFALLTMGEQLVIGSHSCHTCSTTGVSASDWPALQRVAVASLSPLWAGLIGPINVKNQEVDPSPRLIVPGVPTIFPQIPRSPFSDRETKTDERLD